MGERLIRATWTLNLCQTLFDTDPDKRGVSCGASDLPTHAPLILRHMLTLLPIAFSEEEIDHRGRPRL